MMSSIWISQAALKLAEFDFFARIILGAFCMWLFLSIKSGIEEGGITGLIQYLIAGFFYVFSLYSIWNNDNTQRQVERQSVNPKKENKKKKAIPPPVLVDDRKKKNKKLKRSPLAAKKAVSKENKETTDGMTKMYRSFDSCKSLNRSQREIYELMIKLILSERELLVNQYPSEDYQPRTLVDSDNSVRLCVRCNEAFEILKGVYMSATQCRHHPRKATYRNGSYTKLHDCCDSLIGAPGCTVSNRHVTLQHGPRTLTKTTSKRHIRKDLQNRIFGLDCEMSYTTGGLEITRVALVNIDGHPVYETYVKPKNMILDYNTMYSGVEKRHLENITTTIDNVIFVLNSMIFEDTILVGHALNNDLAALGLIHKTVIDTSVLYPNPKCPSKKLSLKHLASEFLNITVQEDAGGHDCIEDARTALQLALLKVPRHAEAPVPRNRYKSEALTLEHPLAVAIGHKTTRHNDQPLMEIQNLNMRLPEYEYYQGRQKFPYAYNPLMHRYASPQYSYGC